MNASLAEQLKGASLNFNDYGRLPMREDMLLFGKTEGQPPVIKQWDKLRLIRKNLFVLSKYLQKNNGETVSDWIHNNRESLSDNAIAKIGNYNDETGGISAYFFNLQNFYDQQEQDYDATESKSIAPPDAKEAINKMRLTRTEKRKVRGVLRKEKLKNLKSDGKGFLVVEMDEPPTPAPVKNADGEKPIAENPKPVIEKKPTDAAVEEIYKTRRKIGIALAGTVIFITAVTLYFKSRENE